MMSAMIADDRRIYPVMPAHGTRIHLGHRLRIHMGLDVDALCGHGLLVGIGGRRVSAVEWETLHDSLRCQRCVQAYESRKG